MRTVRTFARTVAANPAMLLLCATLALGLIAGYASQRAEQRIGVPVPLLVYEVEAVSGDHEASILNLGIAPLGVVPLPTPVDVDGDLVPDVTVAVNLVNVAGLFGNPTDIGEILAPNLEINRLLPGLPITPVNPPLRINVKLTVLDVGGTSPPTYLRLGYDTGPGGSIPATFKVVASGLTGFFDPVVASVEAPGYEGPLTLVAGIEQGDERADADLRFLPLPGGLEFSYGSDGGEHLTIAHNGAAGTTAADREVDLAADVNIADGADHTAVKARVDRLPRSVDVTIAPGGEGSGGFDYLAPADGRLPDVRIDVTDLPADDKPLIARLDLEALPPELHAAWSLPDEGNTAVSIAAPVRPIGAVEARVANFTGTSSELPSYIPTARQFVDLRQAGSEGDRLVTGRIEGISLVELIETDQGVDARFESAGGGQPLELNASLGDVGEQHRRIDALTTISPLPTEITATITDAGEDQLTEPFVIVYESSDSVDVDGHVEVRREGQTLADPCGTAETLCADLSVRDLPARIETQIVKLEEPDDDSDADTEDERAESRIAVESLPRLDASRPDIAANLTLADEEGEVVEASVSAQGIPPHVNFRLLETDGSLASAEFHACDRDYVTGVCAGSEESIGSVDFAVRNFLEADRPTTLPRPILDRPEHVVVVGDGTEDGMRFEAAGRFTAVEEVQYLAHDATGLRVQAGAGQEFLGEIHLRDIDPDPGLPDPEDTDPDADKGGKVFDLDASLGVPALPSSLDMCFRPQGQPIASTVADPVTELCSTTAPFGDDVDLEGSPISFAYRAPTTFDIDGQLRLREQGRLAIGAPDPVADDSVVEAGLDVTGLPEQLVTYLLLPSDEGEPDGPSEALRAHLGATDDPQKIVFHGSSRKGDAACKDPRPGAEATCVSGTLEQFPRTVDLFFDPSQSPTGPVVIDGADNNLVLTTDGSAAAKLSGFEFSSVTPVEDAQPARSDVVVIDGTLTGIPSDVVGKLRSPDEDIEDDEAEFEILAAPSLGEIDLNYRNFLPPDLFDAVPPAHVDPGTPIGQQIAVQAAGDDVKARIQVKDLTRVAYRSVRDATGAPLDTKVVGLGFGGGAQGAHVYADVQKLSGGAPERLTTDIVLTNLPVGIEACVRGERTASASPAPGTATWCDAADADQGAFRVEALGAASGINMDAYARQEKAGGSDLLAARLGIVDLPPIVQAILPGAPDTDLNLEGFAGTTPTGIGRTEVELALARDIEVDGWSDAVRPFTRRPLPTEEPFPAPPSSNQHFSVAQANDILHLRARIGPDSRLQRLRMLATPCAAPLNNPPDYPYYPLDDKSSYRCVAANFAPSAVGDPLDLSFAKQDGNAELTRLHSAGLTDVPGWFQMTLAESETTSGAEQTFRRRCDTAARTGQPVPPQDCVPPLLRFDQDLPDSQLFGVLETGDPTVLFTAPSYVPTCPPGTAPCAPDFNVVPPPGDPGLRVKVLDVKPHPFLPSATGVSAAFRLGLKQSLTVQQPQTWSLDRAAAPGSTAEKAKDLRVAYAVRNAAGQLVEGGLGELSAFIVDGAQETLITDAGDLTQGVALPGEFGLDLYLRDSAAQGRKFTQVDGRTSTPFSAAVRTFDPSVRLPNLDDSVNIDAAGLERVTFALLHAPAFTPDMGFDAPSFRVRFELLKPPDAVGGPPSNSTATVHQQFVGDLTTTLDFDPDANADGTPDGSPARRIEAVMLLDTPRVGLELAAFADLDGTTKEGTPADFTAHGGIDFDKFNYNLHDSPGDTHIEVTSTLNVQLTIDNATNFRLRNNVAKLDTMLFGPNAALILGPIDWNPEHFRVEVDSAFGIQAEVNYKDCFPIPGDDPYACGGDRAPYPPINAQFATCQGPKMIHSTDTTLTGLHLNPHDSWNGSIDITQDPLDSPLSILDRFSVNLKWVPPGIEQLLEGLNAIFGGDSKTAQVRAHLCGFETGDYELIFQSDPAKTALHPGDPLAAAGHDVPPASAVIPPSGPARVNGGVLPGQTPPPNVDITSFTELCGIHRFGTLTVGTPTAPATLKVSDHAIATPPSFSPLPACLAGAEGTLGIFADHVVIHPGSFIDADNLMGFGSGTPRDNGIGGAGHGGGGGATADQDPETGSGPDFGQGGATYGDLDTFSLGTEPGSAGGGIADIDGGKGGGMILISADDIVVSGAISANGFPGESNDCSTNRVGAGGGSGGGISLSAVTVDVTGTGYISAHGGDGGTGAAGGGGGGGGVVKVHSPDFNGTAFVGGGDGGVAACTGFSGLPGSALAGQDDYYKPFIASEADGVAVGGTVVTTGWAASGDGLKFGYDVTVPFNPIHPPGGDFTMAFLCLVPRSEADQTFTMPTPGGSGEEPCGREVTGDVPPRGGVLVTQQHQSATADVGIGLGVTVAVGPNNRAIPVTGGPLPDGMYGSWVHICRVTPFFDGDGNVLGFGYNCADLDPIPLEPDYVFGVDTQPDAVTVEVPELDFIESLQGRKAYAQSTARFAGDTTPVTVGIHIAHTNGAPIDRVECRIGSSSQFFRCEEGIAARGFPDGASSFSVRVFDTAGNMSTGIVSPDCPFGDCSQYPLIIIVDATMPTATIGVEAQSPVGNAPWHRVTPLVSVTVTDDGDETEALAEQPVIYTIDGGAEQSVDADDCDRSESRFVCPIPLDPTLLTGRHTITYTSVDRAGNRRFVQTPAESLLHPERDMLVETILVDRDPPRIGLLSVPAAADGANGWFVSTPLAVLGARDGLGGSGLGPSTLTVNGVSAPYVGPRLLTGEGPISFCGAIEDVAGNPASQCAAVQVDLGDPTVTVTVPAPHVSGWHLSPPTVTVTATDAVSGVAPFANGPAAQCVTGPVADAVSGLCVSIDGGPFLPSAGTHVIPEGVHTVRAFAIDGAGRRSVVVERTIRVDLSTPVATHRLVPPDPARGQWWRRIPTLVLRATDGEANAGVARIEYQLDSGSFETYEGPVDLSAGVHTITYRAVDKAGRTSVPTTVQFSVDDVAPMAKALSPDPLVWLKLLGPANAKLKWTVGDDRSSQVRVTVLVVDLLGNTIRRLDAGTQAVTSGGTVDGSTNWNGKNDAGQAVIGIFHYRVIAVDEAGNRSQSGESRPIQVKLL